MKREGLVFGLLLVSILLISGINSCNKSANVPTSLCSDSDGRNYNTKGEINLSGNIATDYCPSKSSLTEYYCDNGALRSETVHCEFGCQDGTCLIEEVKTIETNCSDGTPYGVCSVTKPLFCNNGTLIDRAGSCGCPPGNYDIKIDSCVLSSEEGCYYGTISCASDEQCINNQCVKAGACQENWNCHEWAECANELQTRTCTDINNCGTTANKPIEQQECLLHPNPPQFSLTQTERAPLIQDPKPSGVSGCIIDPDYPGCYRCYRNGVNDRGCYTQNGCESSCQQFLNYTCIADNECSDDDPNTFDYCEYKATSSATCKHLNFKCRDLLIQGSSSNKLDIVFLFAGISTERDLSLAKEKIIDHIKELLRREPFYSNYKKINFHLMDISFPDTALKQGMDYFKTPVQRCFNNLESDQVIIFTESIEGVGQGQGGKNNISLTDWGDPQITVHEFGHTFGGLGDEYLYNFHSDGRPNDATFTPLQFEIINLDDTPGCPKWCSGEPRFVQDECTVISDETECKQHNRVLSSDGKWWTPRSLTTSCVWLPQLHPVFKSRCVKIYGDVNIGTNCLPGSGCYYGAQNSQTWERSVPTSIMSILEDDMPFCPICVTHMAQLLDNYT
jgi:hypothetical protein